MTPMKLSEFIREVVETVRQVPRDKYIPKSIVWHTPHQQDDSLCLACLAGLYAAAKAWIQPHEILFGGGDRERYLSNAEIETILAIESIRTSQWLKAQTHLAIPKAEQIDLGALHKEPPPQAEAASFYCWEDLDRHLASLEDRALKLQTQGY